MTFMKNFHLDKKKANLIFFPNPNNEVMNISKDFFYIYLDTFVSLWIHLRREKNMETKLKSLY
jgi:hypothetical protein